MHARKPASLEVEEEEEGVEKEEKEPYPTRATTATTATPRPLASFSSSSSSSSSSFSVSSSSSSPPSPPFFCGTYKRNKRKWRPSSFWRPLLEWLLLSGDHQQHQPNQQQWQRRRRQQRQQQQQQHPRQKGRGYIDGKSLLRKCSGDRRGSAAGDDGGGNADGATGFSSWRGKSTILSLPSSPGATARLLGDGLEGKGEGGGGGGEGKRGGSRSGDGAGDCQTRRRDEMWEKWWTRMRCLRRRRRGAAAAGYVALGDTTNLRRDSGCGGNSNEDGYVPGIQERGNGPLKKEEGWWSILVVGVGSVARLYVPVSDLDVLDELDVKSFSAARQRRDGRIWEGGIELDDLRY
ncbi:hypothetical protein VTK26DRAFT_7467 [Humicola hyalothermophila]